MMETGSWLARVLEKRLRKFIMSDF